MPMPMCHGAVGRRARARVCAGADEVWNDSAEPRLVFIVDIWHPQLVTDSACRVYARAHGRMSHVSHRCFVCPPLFDELRDALLSRRLRVARARAGQRKQALDDVGKQRYELTTQYLRAGLGLPEAEDLLADRRLRTVY